MLCGTSGDYFRTGDNRLDVGQLAPTSANPFTCVIGNARDRRRLHSMTFCLSARLKESPACPQLADARKSSA
jgi:hypothetical protein